MLIHIQQRRMKLEDIEIIPIIQLMVILYLIDQMIPIYHMIMKLIKVLDQINLVYLIIQNYQSIQVIIKLLKREIMINYQINYQIN